jgi:hypothetical protein
MATVTISAEDLQFVYSQLNFLRNYVGVWSLDWQEHVIAAAAPAPAAAPVPAAVPAPVPATGTAAPAVVVAEPAPTVVVAEPAPTVVVAAPAAASKAAPVTAIGSPVSKKF